MTVVLILGLVLLGYSVTRVVRALTAPRTPSGTLRTIGQYGYEGAGATAPTFSPEPGAALEPDRDERPLDRLALNIGELLGKRLSWVREDELRIRLISAGLYSTNPTRFLGYQGLIALGLLMLWVWIAALLDYSVVGFIVGCVAACAIGWFIPAVIVWERTRRRREQIEYELPELIDLLVVCIEAGLSLPGALRVASREVHGPLGEELRLTLQEQNMGLAINEALENLVVRADTPSTRIFVRSVTQGETLGVSIGQVMRNLATEMRKRRKAAAEERAQKAPLKMVFPLVLLIAPAMFIVLLVPALLQIADVFS